MEFWIALAGWLTALGLGIWHIFDRFDLDKKVAAKYEKVISDLNRKIDKLQGQRK